jgi:hypothetical protein
MNSKGPNPRHQLLELIGKYEKHYDIPSQDATQMMIKELELGLAPFTGLTYITGKVSKI